MNRRIAIATSIVASLFITPIAHSSCIKSTPVFACTTTKGKYVEVCDAGKVIQYSFGKKGAKPEIALSVPRDKVTTFQWDGRGSSITYSVQIPNENTVYEVFRSTDRMSDEHQISAGINVEVDGKQIATLSCKTETVVNNIEDISLRPAPWQ